MLRVITEKVVAYITQGDRPLVFSHPLCPEAGVQVPAGTIEEGEAPALGNNSMPSRWTLRQ